MNAVERRHLTEDTFRDLLESRKERAYVVFSNLDQPHEHVRFLFEYGLFAADVCSREWGTVPRPLPDEAVERLAKLGFVRSTRFRLNFGKSGSSPNSRALAELPETLFRVAYDTHLRFRWGPGLSSTPPSTRRARTRTASGGPMRCHGPVWHADPAQMADVSTSAAQQYYPDFHG